MGADKRESERVENVKNGFPTSLTCSLFPISGLSAPICGSIYNGDNAQGAAASAFDLHR